MDDAKASSMKLVSRLAASRLTSLGFQTGLALAAGGVLTALLLRWITL